MTIGQCQLRQHDTVSQWTAASFTTFLMSQLVACRRLGGSTVAQQPCVSDRGTSHLLKCLRIPAEADGGGAIASSDQSPSRDHSQIHNMRGCSLSRLTLDTTDKIHISGIFRNKVGSCILYSIWPKLAVQ